MRIPRGSAFTLLSIATGIVAALAVGTTWFPMMRERQRQALDDQARELELVGLLAIDRLRDALAEGSTPLLRPPPPSAVDIPPAQEEVEEIRGRAEEVLSEITELADVERILLVDPRGRLLGATPPRPPSVYGDIVPDPAIDACGLGEVIEDRRTVRATLRAPSQPLRQVICQPLRQAEGGPAIGMLAIVGRGEATILATRQGGRELLLLLTAATVAGLVTVAGMRRLLAPLTAVSRAAARIAAGERGVRVEPRGPQEVQQLARA
ncbi:MAG: HAMP domain-containing protein, partial [Deltaproteobacteria bacterium]